MKKNIIASIAVIAIIANTAGMSFTNNTNVYADDVVSESTYLVNGDEVTLVHYPATKETEIFIPEEIDGKPVTTIGAEAFRNNTTVTKIHIPDSVQCIENDAFADCIKLQSVLFNNTYDSKLATIGENAFCNCPIRYFTFPRNVERIDYSLFGISTEFMKNQIKSVNNQEYNTIQLCIPNENCHIYADNIFTNLDSCTLVGVGNSDVQSYSTEKNLNFSVLTQPYIIEISESIEVKYNCSVYMDSVIINSCDYDGDLSLGTLDIPEYIDNKKVVGINSITSKKFKYINIPKTVETIKKLPNNSYVQSITVYNPKCEFVGCVGLSGNSTTVLKGYDNSTAYDYSNIFGNQFESIGPFSENEADINNVNEEQDEMSLRIKELEEENANLKEENNNLQRILTSYGNRAYGDMNNDNIVDGRDATILLTYYAKTSVGYVGSLDDFIKEQNEE